MTRPSRFAIAKQKLIDDIEGVIADLCGGYAKPKQHKRGRRWNIVNKWRAGAEARQMIVWLNAARRGGWCDFVSGEKGDAIDLVAYWQEGIVHADSRMRAVEWAEDRYGLRQLDPESRAKIAAAAAARTKRLEEEHAASQAEQRQRVRKFFYACHPTILGTPVETYLAGRGIRLADVPNLTHSFRYRPDCEYWPLQQEDGEGRRIGPGPRFPAMVAAMVSADGRLNACHLTFLAADGRGKAPVRELAERRGLDPDEFNEKLFKGDVAGFVIRVTNGPSGLSAERAAEAGVTGIIGHTEGIEDAMAAAIASTELRMWAAGSLSSLLYVPDHRCASAHLMFRDNDWLKPQAQALFARARARMQGFGKPVEETAMPADWGKDVNDAINA